jgi:serine/threonine protein kinase
MRDPTGDLPPAPGPQDSPLLRAKHIFLSVRDLSSAERPGEIERLCAGDAELRRRVEDLLVADDAPQPFESLADEIAAARATMESTPVDTADDVIVDTQIGNRIGRYRVLEKIAEGGFGVVYLAEQDEPVRRQVALKVIKLGMDTRQVVARFGQERQALAMMDHPNIAKVHDAGATPTGRPYFVMEFCRGEAITSFCDQKQLPVSERLRLFAQVCHAVQHAHQKGVIHRDIKPSNILVPEVDGQPLAKVIDFGIAKATESRASERTMMTERGQLMGTPAYMSPEQALGDVDIDTRTDVYSLGVLLYELVTGETPIPVEALRSTPTASMHRLLAESEAKPPSTRIKPDSGGSRAAATARGTDPARLRATLRRELDWIILKALERERQRRYGTAAELAADIERHLAGEAVLAAPPSRWYALRKSVRRNRGTVIAALLVIAALTLGLIGTISQTLEARRQTAAAVAAAKAEAERSKELTAVTEFQSQMLAGIDAFDVGLGLRQDLRERMQSALTRSQRPLTEQTSSLAVFDEALDTINFTDAATELVDRVLLRPAIAEIAVRFADNPRVNAQLRETVGLVYEALGRWGPAREQFDHVLAVATELNGEYGEKTLAARCEIAYLIKLEGNLAEAAQRIEAALPQMKRVLGPDNEFTLRACAELASLWRLQGRGEDAIRLYRDTLERFQRTLPANADLTISTMAALGRALSDHGELPEAERLVREVLGLRRSQKGDDHPDTLAAAHNLGQLLLKKRDLEAAQLTLEDVVTRRTRLLGLGHPRTANSVLLLAETLEARGDTAGAQARINGLLAAVPDGQPSTIVRIRANNRLGLLHQRAGRFSDAEAAFLESRSLTAGAKQPTRDVDRLLQSLYRAWHTADPTAGADAKLAAITARLEPSPDFSGPASPEGAGKREP